MQKLIYIALQKCKEIIQNYMTNTPLFSVLIANYNNGRYLQEAIDSVLAQSYTNWEVIIVDDGSTDNSSEIYEKYKQDPRFHMYYNEQNMGCGYTKRRCVEMANGDICGFLDSDDELYPDAILEMISTHSSNPKVAIVYSRCHECDADKNIINSNRLLQLKEKETYFDYRWYGAMNFVSFKREKYFLTEGISSTIKAGVDQDLYFKVEEVGDIFVLNKFTYKYIHRSSESITHHSNFAKLWYWNLRVREATCIRRNLPINDILEKDFQFILDGFEKEIQWETENKIRKTKTYKIGNLIRNCAFWRKNKRHY